MKFRSVIAAVLCALWAAAPLVASPHRTVALSFETTPHNVSGFAVPLINDLGQTAFLGGFGARVTSPSSYHTGERAWSEATGRLESVASIGDAPSGVPLGVTISVFNQIGFNNFGSTVVRAQLTGTGVNTTNNFATYFSSTTSGLHLISRTGSPAPGTPGATFGALQSLILNNADEIAFRCYLSPLPSDSIWLGEIGSLSLVAHAGTLPGTTTNTSFREPVLNDGGTVAFSVSSRIWAGQPGSLQIIAQTGGAVPGSTSGETFSASFADPVINTAGHIAFSAGFSGSNGIWSNRSGSLSLVTRNGEPAPGTSNGVAFATTALPVLSNADRIAFRGTLAVGGEVTTANDSGIWSDAPGALTLVAREGDAAPDTTAGTVFGQFDNNSYTLNVLGQTAFLGRLVGAEVTTANDVGIWATDQSGTLQLIAREGDSLEVGSGDTRIIKELLFFSGTGNGDSRMSGFNELGQLAYWARFADNTEGFFDNSEGIFVSYAVAASIPGDFNHDGNVDSADYVAWRKTDGTELGYNTWRTHFGVTSTPASIATSLVPEPTTTILGAAFACVLSLQQRRARFTRLSSTCSASALPANGLL